MKEIIGKKINKIFIDSTYLRFETDHGSFSYKVSGDCCSSSYFHDFIGVEKLLKNGEIKLVEEIEMDEVTDADDDQDCVQAYGYRLTTEDEKFGEVSSVLSFRNESNGYYGGSMGLVDSSPENLPEITTDWIND